MRSRPEIPSEIEEHRDARWRRDPILQVETAADAERFIETADLSEYDLSGFRPMRFEFESQPGRTDVRREQEAHPLGPGSDLP